MMRLMIADHGFQKWYADMIKRPIFDRPVVGRACIEFLNSAYKENGPNHGQTKAATA
jgi:hypothetical protein